MVRLVWVIVGDGQTKAWDSQTKVGDNQTKAV
jgi:hypothetical protein